MMEKRLHSLETYLYKYVLPIFFFPWDGFRSLNTALPSHDPAAVKVRWLFLGLWLVVIPFLFWYAYKLKRVILRDGVLVVKGYLNEIEIPLADIASIEKTRWPNMRYAVLRLRAPSEFGERIRFIPKGWLESVGGRPVLEELQEQVRAARVALHSKRNI